MSGEINVERPYYASLFKPKVVDKSEQRYEYVEFQAVQASNTLNQVSRIDFQVQDKTNYWVLSHGRLEHELSIYDETTKTTALTTVGAALINCGYNLYSTVALRLESKLVEEVRYSGIVSTIRNLIKYTLDYAESSATNTHFYLDEGDNGADHSPSVISTTGAVANLQFDGVNTGAGSSLSLQPWFLNFNKGFAIRKSLQNNGGKFRLLLNLREMFGFLGDNEVVITGNQIDIELTKDQNWNRLIHKAGGNPLRIEYHSIKLWLPKSVPSVEQNLKLLKYLESGMETVYQFHQWSGNELTIQGTPTSLRWDIKTVKSKPVAVIVAFQIEGRHTNQLLNGGVFDNVDLTQIYADVNGNRYPERPLEPNFNNAENKYTREYMALLQFAMKCDNVNCIDGSVINYSNFKTTYPLFVIDCSKRDETIADNATQYRIEVEFRTANPLPANTRAYAVIVTEEEVSFKGVGRVMDVFRLNP